MPGPPEKPEQSPADIAREAFRRLATRRIAPTPEAYREIYDEIAGKSQQSSAEKVLADLAKHLARLSEDASQLASNIERSVAQRDWDTCTRRMTELIDQHIDSLSEVAGRPDELPPPAPVSRIPADAAKKPDIAVQLDTPRPTSFSLVDDLSPAAAKPRGASPISTAADTRIEATLRELLARVLTLAVSSLLRATPTLANEAESLALAVRESIDDAGLNDVSVRLKQLCFKIETRSEDMAEEHELLLRLFKLLLENVSELVEDDSWLNGQITSVQSLLDGPLTHHTLEDATRSLKEVIYKQGMLKHSLAEAKITVKNMMITFIDRIGAVAASTGDYHKKIDQYSQKISQAQDITELNNVLDDVMRDTKIAQVEALRSRDEMVSARKEVQDAEARIHELEGKLEQLSELVREDQLTGSLNRRGLDDVFERELARTERRKSPLCIALLDLDDFKRINDTYGHSAGDEALVHLVRVVKDTLRTMDVIARLGGEEFLIVLPDTALPDAMQTVTRLQRELTKRIFMHDNTKLLITFSAGVALRGPDEDQAALIKRADAALYEAKRAGKNRVVAAG